ncbi:hypothetical protein ALC60_14343 [Trachymyrmex zeteki]|uniref:Uncharacterized protein n=1 Tax=Mycetomoellerius zeteki TaxID=64791 RepID=A0A151WFH6_9HYME|nr:hypothetical protein ALC60_14343 [Trachymyrmex zeteki]
MAVDGVIYAAQLGDSLSTEGRSRVGGGWLDGVATATVTIQLRGGRREMDAGIESLGAPSVEQPQGLLNE